MKLFILIAAIIALVFGLAFLLIPSQALSLYGVQPDVLSTFMTRYFGSALLGVGVIFLALRMTKTFEGAIKGVCLGGLVLSIAGLAVAIWDGISGVATDVVWINTAIYGFLTLGFGYFYFKK